MSSSQRVSSALPSTTETPHSPVVAASLVPMGDSDAPSVSTMKYLLSQFKEEVAAVNKSIDDLGGRTVHLEMKMGEVVGSRKDLIVRHEALQAEVAAFRDKVSDLEDRSHRSILTFMESLKRFPPIACTISQLICLRSSYRMPNPMTCLLTGFIGSQGPRTLQKEYHGMY